MPSISELLARVGDVSVPVGLPVAAALRDQELLDGQRLVAEVQRRLAAIGAALAGEIAHRSRRELGHDGLAQSRGQRTAEGLVSQLTGGSAREARTLVQAGELLPAARPDAVPVARWLAVIGEAAGAAAASVAACANAAPDVVSAVARTIRAWAAERCVIGYSSQLVLWNLMTLKAGSVPKCTRPGGPWPRPEAGWRKIVTSVCRCALHGNKNKTPDTIEMGAPTWGEREE